MASNYGNKNTSKTVLNKLPQSSFMSWHAIFHRIGLCVCFTSAIKIVYAGWYLVFHIENSTFQGWLSTGTSCLQRPWTHYHWMIWVSNRTMLWANNCEFRVNLLLLPFLFCPNILSLSQPSGFSFSDSLPHPREEGGRVSKWLLVLGCQLG